jgi:predicted metalloprotease with PDZ domain
VPTVDANQDCRETKVYYRPLITKDFFHVIGHGLFILPGCFELDSRVSVNIYWEGFDTNYSLANSHGVNNHVQKLNISVQELLHAVYTGGDFRIYKIECKQAPIFVAIRGNWLFKDTDFVLMVNKIISAQREFWNDYDFPYFLITVIPVIKSENICMTGGTGLENSFAMFLGSKKFMTLHKLAWTISHEHFHTWNGRKIGRQEPEALIYWFAEGFTSYYTVLLNLRAGIYTIDNYVKEYNKTLLNYFISPVRNEENIEILKKFWVNHDIEHLPYYRGTILAHEWNLHIKKESKERYSLDNVMFDILYQAQKNKRVFTAELFDNVIKKYLKEGVAQEIDMYIDRGETIELSPDALGPCFMLAWEKKKIKDKEFIVPYYYCDSSHKLNCAVCKKWFGIK